MLVSTAMSARMASNPGRAGSGSPIRGPLARAGALSLPPRASYYFYFYSYPRSFADRPGEASE